MYKLTSLLLLYHIHLVTWSNSEVKLHLELCSFFFMKLIKLNYLILDSGTATGLLRRFPTPSSCTVLLNSKNTRSDGKNSLWYKKSIIHNTSVTTAIYQLHNSWICWVKAQKSTCIVRKKVQFLHHRPPQ